MPQSFHRDQATQDPPPPPRKSLALTACLKVGISALLVSLLAFSLGTLGASTAVSAHSDSENSDGTSTSDESESESGASSVQIAARKLENGNIEFGLRLAGSELWLPSARYFAYDTVDVGRWLRASPYTMADGREARIRARKLDNSKVEFVLQIDTPWHGTSYQWLPSSRMFPYRTASVGQWLYSSDYSYGIIGAWELDYHHSDGDPFLISYSGSYVYQRPQEEQGRPSLFIACDQRSNMRVQVAWHDSHYANSEADIIEFNFAYRFDKEDYRPDIGANSQTGEIYLNYTEGETNRILTVERWFGVKSSSSAIVILPGSPQVARSFVDLALEADYVLMAPSDLSRELVGYAVFELGGLDTALRKLSCY